MNRLLRWHGAMSCWFLGVLLLTAVTHANATIDAYEFADGAQEDQFRALIKELRCPKCQNQNISDSDAGLAKDIKDRAYRLIKEGRSNADITDYMVERYGDFITYRPPLRKDTWWIWFGPLILAGFVGFALWWRIAKATQTNPQSLNAEQQARIETLLQDLAATDTSNTDISNKQTREPKQRD